MRWFCCCRDWFGLSCSVFLSQDSRQQQQPEGEDTPFLITRGIGIVFLNNLPILLRMAHRLSCST